MTATAEPEVGAAVPAPTSRRPRGSRLSGGHLLIALAAITAVVANYAVLRARDDSVRITVVAAPVAAGEPVDTRALGFADVRVDDDLLATLVTPADLAALEGHVAASALRPGEPLRASDLHPPAAPGGQRAMSVPIAPEHAVGGRLAVGDRVDVIEVRAGEAIYLVTDAEVLDVPEDDARPGLGGLRSFSVTLAVDDETALRLALALHAGELQLVRATGAAPATVERLGAAHQRPGAGDERLPATDERFGAVDEGPGGEGGAHPGGGP